MKFTDALKTAYQIPWSFANTFEVYFDWNPKMLSNSRAPTNIDVYEPDAANGNVLAWNDKDNERLSLHLIDLTLPQLTYSLISSYNGKRYSHHTGRPAEYKFNMKFRDSNQLEFYRLFCTQFREQDYRYFDDVYFDVFVSKDSDYGDGINIGKQTNVDYTKQSSPLMSLKRCLIESISQLNFSNNTQNQHIEFSVDFIANDIEIYDGGARQFYVTDDWVSRIKTHWDS